jgi:serine/threonine protein kinase
MYDKFLLDLVLEMTRQQPTDRSQAKHIQNIIAQRYKLIDLGENKTPQQFIPSFIEKREPLDATAYQVPSRRSYKIQTNPMESDRVFHFVVDGVTKRKLKVIKKLGEGGFGRVYQAEDVTFERLGEISHYALKIVDTVIAEDVQQTLQWIKEIGKGCRYIAEILEDYFLPTFNQLYIVTKLYKHRSLERFIEMCTEPLPQASIEKIIHDLFHALGILHTHKPPIAHRDISQDNLLVKYIHLDGTIEIVLNDFDFARPIDTTKELTITGKPRYLAPEVQTGRYDVKVDIFSAGIVLYEIMTLSRNRVTIHDEKTFSQMRVALEKTNYEKKLIDLVLSMCNYDPTQRPTAVQVFSMYEQNGVELVKYGCQTETMSIVSKACSMGYYSLTHACKSGNKQIIDKMIEGGDTRWDDGLEGACIGGKKEILFMMVRNGAKDWSRALYGACLGVIRILFRSSYALLKTAI